MSGAFAAIAMLFAVPRAEAAITLGGLTAKPANTDAGAHSAFTFHIGFGGADFVKDLTVHLPPGQVADPTATPLCTVAQLNANSCPASSQVGSVTTNVTVSGVIPLSVPGKIYNLTPQPGEPARFGIVLSPAGGLLPRITLQSAVKLRTTDYGLDSVIHNIPNNASGLSTHIDSMTVTLFGNAGSPSKPFSRNPTSCTPATTGFSADSYQSTSATGSASYTPTNCGALDFSPTFSAKIGSAGHTAAGSKPPLTTIVDQDAGEAGAQEVDAILPKNIGADAAALGRQCPLTSFQTGTCPASTVVGKATAVSPFLTQPLTGPVSIVTAAPGQALPRLGLDLQGPLHIQLFGSFTLSAAGPGNSFVGIPDIPLSHFVLSFAAGDLVVSSRDLCTGGAPVFGTKFVGWNGATRTGNVAATVQGCGGGGGGGGGGHAKPKARIKITNTASKKPRLKLTVKDKAKIKQTKLKLPKTLSFGTRKAVRHGISVSGGRVVSGRFTARSLKLKTKPTPKLVEKVARGALTRTGKIAGKKLRFKLAVKDAKGKTTKLKLATKARR